MHFNVFGMELSQKGGRMKFNVVDECKYFYNSYSSGLVKTEGGANIKKKGVKGAVHHHC